MVVDIVVLTDRTTFVTVHTFYASRGARVSMQWCPLIQGDLIAQVKTMWRKQNLASALCIQKEILAMHFS